MPAPVRFSEADSTWLGFISSLAVQTLIVYILALHISAMLVGRWFAWVAPVFQFHPPARFGDWYLQHLELVTIVPALVAGYLNVARFIPAIVGGQVKEARREPAAVWVWTIPTLVLLYRMVQYHPPSSVLFGSSMSAFRYFFDIEREMPRLTDVLVGDPVRVWAQMSVTAPFYAGVSYSLGALSLKYEILQKIFTFQESEATLTQVSDGGEATPEPPSSSAD